MSASFGLGKRLAVQGGVSVFTKSSSAVAHASIPHPFLFNQARVADVALDSVAHREITARMEIAVALPLVSRLQAALSGGPALVQVSQAFLTGVDVQEAFPFSSIAMSTSTTESRKWGVGATGAADLEWRATDRVGVGLTARYTRATVDAGEAKVRAGGPSGVASVRIRLH